MRSCFFILGAHDDANKEIRMGIFPATRDGMPNITEIITRYDRETTDKTSNSGGLKILKFVKRMNGISFYL